MNNTIKNVFFLGVTLLAGLVSWVWVEISKSNELIAIANDPIASANRGFEEALSDYRQDHKQFVEVYIPGEGYKVPGISESALKGSLQDFAPNTFLICGTGLHYKNFALGKGSHEYNKYFAQAYNAKLLELLASERP
ncbi:hypothetical protein P3339_17260 [Microbulbifer sp. MLAF003]|uniref:hypothetical protein n=1 Tax=Microbulbifer sp. MLAF003 TaxID=3032582 RepID=UPI0024AD6243|nr:hypothetical protein [Microbulbifer sp. MLAF003]WHI50180.1 hypothetical protein P3339_17260 [Microbulbifer sp. MLAF003]